MDTDIKMRHVKLVGGIPEMYHVSKLRQDNPNVSLPRDLSDELLASYDVYPLVDHEQPEYDASTHTCKRGDITLVDGVWVRPWVVTAKTTETVEAETEVETNGMVGDDANNYSKVMLRTLADILMVADPTISKSDARTFVRTAMRKNLRKLKGLT